jgi:AcrR family transcriptional regulator
VHDSRPVTARRPAKRPGGRTAAVSSAIKSEQAGVNATTVYRRWPDAATMINDIATYRLDPERPLPDTGDLRSDVAAWATEIMRHYRQPVNAALLRAGAAAAGDNESDCLRGRLDEAALLVDRAGADTGVTAQDVVDGVLAPIMYRVIFLPATVRADYAEQLADKVLGRA